MITRNIFITTQKEFIHQYVDAPEEVWFLRDLHRHMLHVKVEIEVFNNDRELEFIILKRELEDYLDSLDLCTPSNRSCETIAESILNYFQEEYGSDRDLEVTVSEDGENGSTLKYTKEV